MIEVPLSQGKFAFIDEESAWILEKHRFWHACRYKKKFYAEATFWKDGKSQAVKMHRLVTNCPDGLVVDHINGDTLDNRLENLRVCTQGQNVMNQSVRIDNKSGYRGVHFDSPTRKWRARIWVNKKCFHLGLFDSPLDAHAAYCAASSDMHGEFGRTK